MTGVRRSMVKPAAAGYGAHVGGDQGGDVRERRCVHVRGGSFAFGVAAGVNGQNSRPAVASVLAYDRLALLRGLVCGVASVLRNRRT